MSAQYIVSRKAAQREDCTESSFRENAHSFYPYHAWGPSEA